ncbi:hypothetical protein [Sporosarcina koreensis]|uniref:Uncharacterized protein n=1 Tax=Sporosarcina koreensis TaxID=334735 RepID=A0ABW0TV20_9BACL
MQKKWRKTGAALLIAGLTISGTGYALADGGKVTEIIDLSELNKNTVEEKEVIPVREVPIDETTDVTVLETETTQSDETDGTTDPVKEEGKQESDKDVLPEIPEGYTAGNLAALAKAYEQAGNPTAKAAIKRNMERSIAKWESKQPVVETPKVEVKEEAPVTEETPKVEEPAKVEEPVKDKAPVKEEKPAKVKEKNPQAELNAKHKEQKDALKAAQKAEREALKEERKAAKEESKAAKEQQKKDKKEKKN